MSEGSSDPHAFIEVRNPVSVRADRLPVERVPIGIPGDYKPSIALLADRELLLTAFHQVKLGDGKIREDMLLVRSRDGGRTWSDRAVTGLVGREPYFSVARDGTLFITAHLLAPDVRNARGYIHSYLHRSTDGGRTWSTRPIAREDVPGSDQAEWILTSRNVLELADGTLILGVSAPGGSDWLWRSTDGAETWDTSLRCAFEGVDPSRLSWPFMAETVFWQACGGDLLALFRVDPRVFPMPGSDPPGGDQGGWYRFERLVLFRSGDGGSRWTREPEIGSFYGEMYPAILRLADGRLLLTFTVRDLRPPLGVQAVLGIETPDGFAFAFDRDRFVIDAKTPLDRESGGGFGPTLQLADGTLVTAYSWMGGDGVDRAEVARWRIPPA